MASQFKQISLMTVTSLRSLPRRLWMSLSMVLSVALVVTVLIGFLAMAKGFEQTLTGAGSPSIAIILGGGTNQEVGSEISADAIRNLRAASGDIGILRGADGNLLISREIVVPVDVKRGSDGAVQTLALRGMDSAGPSLRKTAPISTGRSFTPGSREIVVGARLAKQYPSFDLGDTVRLGAVDWTVVGQFNASGGAAESEIWGDLEAVQSAFDRMGQVQAVRAQLLDPNALKTLQAALPQLVRTPLVAISEPELLASQSEQTSNLIRLFGWPLAILMAVGATAGALNTMMTSVSNRSKEIATVRALGFSRLSAFFGTWIEAVVLSAVGAVTGTAGSWLLFNGWQASTLGPNGTQMAFQLRATTDVLLTGGVLGLAVGFIGGALPALAATRIRLTAALRSGN